MKKALHESDELYEDDGKVFVWNFTIGEIVETVNNKDEKHHPVLEALRGWIIRYLTEGVTENLLNDLNATIGNINFSKVIMPSDIYSNNFEAIKSTYICRNKSIVNFEMYAANDFAKLLTNGDINRIKHCSLEECENIFLARPQAKWCSKACGSKYRVRKKRKTDAQ